MPTKQRNCQFPFLSIGCTFLGVYVLSIVCLLARWELPFAIQVVFLWRPSRVTELCRFHDVVFTCSVNCQTVVMLVFVSEPWTVIRKTLRGLREWTTFCLLFVNWAECVPLNQTVSPPPSNVQEGSCRIYPPLTFFCTWCTLRVLQQNEVLGDVLCQNREHP